MIHSLTPHPASPAHGVHALQVDLASRGGNLALHYRLDGDLASLRIPEPGPAARTDELWRHTCFEVFIAPASSAGYLEYNFSPSRAWAAYSFSGYRAGMAPLAEGAAPVIECSAGDRGLELRVTLDLAWLVRREPLRLGVTAVIEARAGGLSYWALAHSSEKPDFHRAESFVAAVP